MCFSTFSISLTDYFFLCLIRISFVLSASISNFQMRFTIRQMVNAVCFSLTSVRNLNPQKQHFTKFNLFRCKTQQYRSHECSKMRTASGNNHCSNQFNQPFPKDIYLFPFKQWTNVLHQLVWLSGEMIHASEAIMIMWNYDDFLWNDWLLNTNVKLLRFCRFGR